MLRKRSSQWKVREAQVATFFNTKRRPLSGLNHGTGRGDDCQHERLYIECKYGSTDALVKSAWNLYDHTLEKCTKETKSAMYPILALMRTSRPGFLIQVHSSDLEKLCVEYLTQLGYGLTHETL